MPEPFAYDLCPSFSDFGASREIDELLLGHFRHTLALKLIQSLNYCSRPNAERSLKLSTIPLIIDEA